MLNRADRREWAVLGLLALAWALLAAPVIHRFAHEHQHTHAGQQSLPGAPHGIASVEHQSLNFTSPLVMPVVRVVLIAVGIERVAVQLAPALKQLRRVEQSQAP